MADEQDELAALYGDIEGDEVVNATDAANTAGAPTSAAPGGGEDDDFLFMQLYGDQPAPDEPAAVKAFDPYAAAQAETGQGRMNLPILSNKKQFKSLHLP